MDKFILSIDPGHTSGICIMRGPKDFCITQVYDFEAIEVIEQVEPSLVIIEKFVVQKRPHIDPFPLELIGCVHLMRTRGLLVVEQMPSDIRGIHILQDIGLWDPMYPHAMDAAKHMVLYLLTKAPVGKRIAMLELIKSKEQVVLHKKDRLYWK